MGSAKHFDLILGQETTFAPFLSFQAPENFTLQELTGSSSAILTQVKTRLDLPLEQAQAFEASVEGSKKTSSSVESAGLTKLQTENQKFITKEIFDAAGNKVLYQDAEGNSTRYSHDALNRLVRVEIPDGNTHEVSYDAQGRVAKVSRSEIGQILFDYHQDTGLLKSKSYLDKNQKKYRSADYSWDAAGRKIVRRLISRSRNPISIVLDS